MKYPPFCDIIVIEFNSSKEQETILQAKKIHKYLKERIIKEKIGLLLYSPVPSPVDKIKNKYRYRIVIKCIYDEKINELLKDALKNNQTIKDVKQIIQINPNNMT